MSEILKEWLEEQKTGIIANYNAKGRKASGRFERETYVQMDINKGAIMSPRYAGVMLFGGIRLCQTKRNGSLPRKRLS